MRNESHTTFIGALRNAVESWRKENGWSRESAVIAIVEAHERIAGPVHTGIDFDPPSRDTFERAKVNADRVFRWLDDVTKDNNTCPANFLPSILTALPMETRLALVNQWFIPLEMVCQPMCAGIDDNAQDATLRIFKDLVHSTSHTQTAVADLLDGIAPGELEHAYADLNQSLASIQGALHLVEHRMAARSRGEQ